MEAEHCSREGAHTAFETHSYKSTTTPCSEWMIVRGQAECTAEQMQGGRRIPDVEDLMALGTAREAKLKEAEVLAVVLYTGPMVIALRAPAGATGNLHRSDDVPVEGESRKQSRDDFRRRAS